jgi:hypothetical protein
VNKEKFNPDSIRNAFKFLVDEFGYTVVRDEVATHHERPYAFLLGYSGNDRKILLHHDYKENFFYFFVVRGLDTQYPNDEDTENIIPFPKIFLKFDPEINLNILQPQGRSCEEAANTNAQLLKDLANDILQGRAWV